MPKLTPEREQQIREQYKKTPVYKTVGEKLDIDPRAVKRVVLTSNPSTLSSSTTVLSTIASKAGESRTLAKSKYLPAGDDRPSNEASDTDAKSASSDGENKKIITMMSSKEAGGSTGEAANDPHQALKLIYTAFRDGKTDDWIIATHGTDPEFVKKQRIEFNRMKETDMVACQSSMLRESDARRNPKLLKYVKTFDEKGYLTVREMINFVDDAARELADNRINSLFTDPTVAPPAGWRKVSCKYCRQVYTVNRLGQMPNQQPIIMDGICLNCAPRDMWRVNTR